MNTNTTAAHSNKQQYSHLHRSATQIQSQWRGHKTRRQITDWAIKEFENIVMEIEGKDSEICWNSSKLHTIPMPMVTNTKLSEDENDLDRILSNFVNRNENVTNTNEKYQPIITEKPSFNQSAAIVEQIEAQKQKIAQKLFEEKLKEGTREQEIQTETLRASMTQSMIKEQVIPQPIPQNRRLVTVSTNTSIAFDGIPKIQEQKTQDLSIEIPLEEVSSVHTQEDLSDMLNESAIMMSNLDMLKSFDFSEMKKSSDSNISTTQAPTKSKEPVIPQMQQPQKPIITVSHHDISNNMSASKQFKQSQEIPNTSNLSNNTNRQSTKSIKSIASSVNSSPSSSQTSEKLQQQKQRAKQELQQQMNMIRYEIQLAEEAYSRRKKELVEERKRH